LNIQFFLVVFDAMFKAARHLHWQELQS